jgi:hypothetical protein
MSVIFGIELIDSHLSPIQQLIAFFSYVYFIFIKGYLNFKWRQHTSLDTAVLKKF